MMSLCLVETKCIGYGMKNLSRGMHITALFQPSVPSCSHAREQRNLFPPGVRRRLPPRNPTSAGDNRSRRERRNSPNSFRRAADLVTELVIPSPSYIDTSIQVLSVLG